MVQAIALDSVFDTASIEDVVDSTVSLSNTCSMGIDLSDIGAQYAEVLMVLKKDRTVSPGIERFLKNDREFHLYMDENPQYRYDEVLGAVEGIVSDIFTMIYNFFKRLTMGLWDFIRKTFGLTKNVRATNEGNLRKLRPLFDKHRGDLDKIKISETVPARRDVEHVLNMIDATMQKLLKFDVSKLDRQVSEILDGGNTKVEMKLDYASILGEKYTDDLKVIGISFEEDLPIFESVFTNTKTSSTIGELGYDYTEILDLLRIMEKHIAPFKGQMEKMTRSLDKVTNDITKLKQKFKDDDAQKEQYQEVLENLPKEVSQLVGLFHKLSTAILAYSYKIADIVKCVYEALKLQPTK